jgi:hypothetical protein
LANEIAFWAKDLNAMIPLIYYVDVSGIIKGDISRPVKPSLRTKVAAQAAEK